MTFPKEVPVNSSESGRRRFISVEYTEAEQHSAGRKSRGLQTSSSLDQHRHAVKMIQLKVRSAFESSRPMLTALDDA